MAIEGAPDRDRHGYCFYCHQWHDLADGTRKIPDSSGPLSAMHARGAAITGDASALKFICHRCATRRKLTKRIIYGLGMAIIGGVLLFERLGWLK
jgi:hypothetical protein